eukprot:3761448-Amphidinium_carterae.1
MSRRKVHAPGQQLLRSGRLSKAAAKVLGMTFNIILLPRLVRSTPQVYADVPLGSCSETREKKSDCTAVRLAGQPGKSLE